MMIFDHLQFMCFTDSVSWVVWPNEKSKWIIFCWMSAIFSVDISVFSFDAHSNQHYSIQRFRTTTTTELKNVYCLKCEPVQCAPMLYGSVAALNCTKHSNIIIKNYLWLYLFAFELNVVSLNWKKNWGGSSTKNRNVVHKKCRKIIIKL